MHATSTNVSEGSLLVASQQQQQSERASSPNQEETAGGREGIPAGTQSHFYLPANNAVPIHIEHKKTKLFGKKMSILTMNDRKWLIGVQMSHLLQRETYNLYRSMKVKYINVLRATPDQVDYLVKANVVKPGTRSITFVPFEPAYAYISEEIKKIGTRKKKLSPATTPSNITTSNNSNINNHNTLINNPHPANNLSNLNNLNMNMNMNMNMNLNAINSGNSPNLVHHNTSNSLRSSPAITMSPSPTGLHNLVGGNAPFNSGAFSLNNFSSLNPINPNVINSINPNTAPLNFTLAGLNSPLMSNSPFAVSYSPFNMPPPTAQQPFSSFSSLGLGGYPVNPTVVYHHHQTDL